MKHHNSRVFYTTALVIISVFALRATTDAPDLDTLRHTQGERENEQPSIQAPAISPRQQLNNFFKQGNALFTEKKYAEAVEAYKKGAELPVKSAQLYFNLGMAHYILKQTTEALAAFQQTILLDENFARAHLLIGKIFVDMKQYNEAQIYLENALSLDPNSAEAHLMLGRMHNAKREFSAAMQFLTMGLEIAPDNTAIMFDLANIHNALNHLEQALELYERLLKRIPTNPSIIYNIAYTLKKMGRIEEAMHYYNQTLEIEPLHKEANFSRGLAYITMGDFKAGWPGYEWRYGKPEIGSLRTFPQPRWDGGDLTGKILFLHAEQGLGDTFQFIRLAKIAQEQGGYVIAAVQKPLTDIMLYCPYVDKVIALTDTPPAFDVHASIMSLPFILNLDINDIPTTIPYIFPDENLVQLWKEKLAADTNFKIGICWQGSDQYTTPFLQAAVAQKSMHVSQFEPLCRIPGVSVYSLQRFTGTDQLAEISDDITIITFDDSFDRDHGRFMDTAALIKNLDLVICIDTSICHCAAALGTPTWNMLPNPPDWRWMINRNDTPWYSNMRLFRQPTPGDWNSVITQVTEELKMIVEERNREKY